MNIEQAPALPSNYTKGRAGHQIKEIVIHVADGTYRGTIGWFKLPECDVSANYVVSMKGEVAQCVQDGDTAWQAGDFDVNQVSLGIEHEGQPRLGPWYPTAEQLLASARLVALLCTRYHLVPSELTIIPHQQINKLHICPGPTWPWAWYRPAIVAFMAGRTPPPPPVKGGTPPAVAANAHAPGTGKETLNVLIPGTNRQVGTVTRILGTPKAYLVPGSQLVVKP